MAEVSYTGQIIREAPEIEAYKLGLLKAAKEESERTLDIPAYQAAELSPLQQRAMTEGEAGIGSFAPFLQAGTEAIGQGMQLSQTGATKLSDAAAQAAAGLGTQGYSPTSAQAFINPYQQAVTQNALGEMRRQADIARQGQAAQAIRAGAFGGTREGVQRAETERGIQDVMSQRIMQDYAQNYAQAQQAAQQAFEAQQQRQISQAGLLGQLGQGIGSLAGQQFGIGQNIASGLGALGSQAGQLGVQQAALGEALQRGQLQDIQTLSTLGQQQQAQQQAEFEAQRMTQLQSQYEPYQRLGFLSDIYKGAPTTQSVLASQTAPSASPLAQVVGAGGAALTGGAAAKKIGLL